MKKKLTALWNKVKEYGIDIAFFDALCRICNNASLNEKKHRRILRWIHMHLGKEILALQKEMTGEAEEECIAEDAPIWIYWKQGFSNAPELVKHCLNSVKKHCGNHPVIELSDDNLHEYVTIPDYIMEKAGGVVTFAQLSDIIRLTLLSSYGGIWMDATIFMSREFDAEMYRYRLYSNKLAYREEDSKYVSKNRWSAFFLACGRNNKTIKLCKEVFYLYHRNYGKKEILDYFLIDYVICYLYENRPDTKSAIDQLPENNKFIYWLQKYCRNSFDKRTWEIIAGTTNLFKLDYRKAMGTERSDDYYRNVICRQDESE